MALIDFSTTQNRLKRAQKGEDMAHKHFQQGSLLKRGKARPVWIGRWWEEVMTGNGRTVRTRRSEILGTVTDLPRRRDAERVLADRLRKVNSCNYSLQSGRKLSDFVEEWAKVVLPTLKYATQKSYRYLLRAHLL